MKVEIKKKVIVDGFVLELTQEEMMLLEQITDSVVLRCTPKAGESPEYIYFANDIGKKVKSKLYEEMGEEKE